MTNHIPYTKPSITDLEIHYCNDAVTNGWGEQCYDYINRFESEFKQYLGVKFCIATSSCTGAMQLGLAAINFPRSSEIILADTNWIATAAPIVHQHLVPVFTDIKASTWCIDVEKIEKSITENTRAIVATHLYGNLCDMSALTDLARRYNLELIEDAAEAIGASYNHKKAGSLGRFGVFSFHGTKTITTGEGGMLVTNDAELYEKALTLNNHGRARNEKRQFWPSEIGFKYKMSNVEAAIGCAQLQRVDCLIKRKKEIFQSYSQILCNSDVAINQQEENSKSGYWMINASFPQKVDIEELRTKFNDNGSDARVFFPPLSSLDMFNDLSDKNKVSYDLPQRSINLPSFHDITEAEIQRVCNVLLEFQSW